MKIDKGFGYKKSGIYCITNTSNGKIYIGSSNHIYYRLRRHKSDLLRKVHANIILQNSYNKYSADSFVVSILEECSNELLLQREQYYINTFQPVYNITKEVINNTLSLESRMKISNTMKAKAKQGIRVNPMNEGKRKELNLYDCNCKFIQRFKSYNDTGRFLKDLYPIFSIRSVSTITKSKYGRYKDYFLRPINKPCKKPFVKEGYNIKVEDILTKKHFEFKSSAEAARYLVCSQSLVNRALKKQKVLLKKYTVTLI